ncbi:MAG: tetratricopeptide repeat protein [Planctomycetaceae bacterium]|nr:tetratricopeptide repeat protein [Planctomycetales bacterium]MCB9921918.1 tetratricopeptide repeat protein [Planctomycetaceae bacterium]
MLMFRSCRRFLYTGVAAVICHFWVPTGSSLADDVVIVRAAPGEKQRRVTGTVADYTGESLLLQYPNGRQETIDPDRVIDVIGNWKEIHQSANASFAAGDFGAAEAKYRQALRDEERRWVQRRVLSQLTWCYRYLGRIDDAVKAFAPLYRDDPTTPYIAAIPLTWITTQPNLDVERQATAWLQDKSSAALRLIGASWTLASARRAEAIKALREFVGESDPRIVFLAEAQLWRTQAVTSAQEDVERWRQRIELMPSTIRGGPYYVVGAALSRHEMHEQAAINFMRTAILFSAERDLVPYALLAAGRELETMGQVSDAVGLYREILNKHPKAQVAIDASTRLKQLADGNQK